MTILTTLNKKITIFHKISVLLMILTIPVSIVFLEIWVFTVDFIHEAGHAYFDLLFGDKYTIIYNNPLESLTMISSNLVENVLITRGGVIFTTVFYLVSMLLVFLIFKYKKWQYRTSINLGTDTIGFQINLFLFSNIFGEIILNMLPRKVNTGLSDGGAIFITYLHMPATLLVGPAIIAIISFFLALFYVLSYILLISNGFYCLLKKIDTKYQKVQVRKTPNLQQQ